VSTAQNSGETATPAVGRPFPKGASGNPGGRPKGLARYVRELVGDDGQRIADFMLSILDNETERTETRLRAAEWLADRGFGKTPATLDTSDTDGAPMKVNVVKQSSEHLAAVANILARAGVLVPNDAK
jgi:hypothetical protein